MDKANKAASTRLTRALSERMYFIRHMTSTAEDGVQQSCYLVTGQSGNLYTVSLPEKASPQRTARCNCVDHVIRKTVCKHLIFVCARVLKAPTHYFETEQRGSHSLYTLANRMKPWLKRDVAGEAPQHVENALRKTLPQLFSQRVARKTVHAEDECGICCDALLGERLVFCSYGCGQAVHDACFERYKAVTPDVRCVLCRAEWERAEDELIGKRGLLVGGRLVSVAPRETQPYLPTAEEEAEQEHDEEQQAEDSDWRPERTRPKRKRAAKRKAARSNSSRSPKRRRAARAPPKTRAAARSASRMQLRSASASRTEN